VSRHAHVLLLAAAVLAVLIGATPAIAQERILSYDSEVDVQADGSLLVTERIRVRAEGREIRRGIYRDFPTSYRDRAGNRVRAGLTVVGVERDGRPEPWFTESRANGIRINTGNDDFLPVPAEYTFTLRYRTTRQLGFFATHDELYWNAIGTGWVFPIARGTVDVRLPVPVPVDRMGVEAYTGPQGAQGTAAAAERPAPGAARYRLTAPLEPREGLTIVLTFPTGLIAPPTTLQRAWWLLADNGGILVVLFGGVLLFGFCASVWHRVGRDPKPGIIIPRYEPPAGLTPASLRYVQQMGYDARCFSSDLLTLAVAGHLRIDRQSRLLRRDEWRVERATTPPAGAIGGPARLLLGTLLPPGRDALPLTQTHVSTLSAAREAHRRALDRMHHHRHFERHTRPVIVAALLTAAIVGLAVLVAGGHGVPIIVAVGALMALGLVLFAYLVRAPTTEGRTLLDEIAGLQLYLSVAEREDLARLPGPDQPPLIDAGRYEALLPFAVALEVEDAWTRKFTAAVGAAAAERAAQNLAWYGGTGRVTDLGAFSRSLGSTLSSQIASASKPPGSRSGSGGGGSSGGGGGGGGGGGR
jgi:uncharacterized membrane protein YgcG